jgi:ABC-type transporter Mla subunit MlaD
MSTERKGVEVLVGLFLVIGFAFIGVMVLTFGRVGQSLQKFYSIKVEFPNASGLVKDSDVLLAGARIGHVADPPRLTGKSYTVIVRLAIREDVKIPRKSTFLVGSSGLLGDRYVDVIPQENFDPDDVAQPDEVIQGTRATGMDDLTAKGGVVMDQLIAELDEIKKMTANINQELLSSKNLENLEQTFANLRTTTNNFTESSKKLDGVLNSAQEAVDSAKGTMKTVDHAAADLRAALADYRKVASSATKTIDAAHGLVDSTELLIKQARDGEGALGTLISDRETAENLKALIINLRRSGVLFYKNRPPATPAPAPRSRR